MFWDKRAGKGESRGAPGGGGGRKRAEVCSRGSSVNLGQELEVSDPTAGEQLA